MRWESPEECRATLRDMIKIHQHSRHALPPICAKRTPRISVRVDAVVMLNVALTVSISRDLRSGMPGSERLYSPPGLPALPHNPACQPCTWGSSM